jgi:hypothetical protein
VPLYWPLTETIAGLPTLAASLRARGVEVQTFGHEARTAIRDWLQGYASFRGLLGRPSASVARNFIMLDRPNRCQQAGITGEPFSLHDRLSLTDDALDDIALLAACEPQHE